jgi:hypothetical protein
MVLKITTNDRNVQAAADYFRDFSKRHAFFSDTVIVTSRGAFFKSEPEQAGGIKSMHGGQR